MVIWHQTLVEDHSDSRQGNPLLPLHGHGETINLQSSIKLVVYLQECHRSRSDLLQLIVL